MENEVVNEVKAFVRTFDMDKNDFLKVIEESEPENDSTKLKDLHKKIDIDEEMQKEFRTIIDIEKIEDDRILLEYEYDYLDERIERGETVAGRATNYLTVSARFDTPNKPLLFFYASSDELKKAFSRFSEMIFGKKRQLHLLKASSKLIDWLLEEHEVDKIKNGSVHPNIPGLNSIRFTGTFPPENPEFESYTGEGRFYTIKYRYDEKELGRIIKIGTRGLYKIKGEKCTRDGLEEFVIFLYDKMEDFTP